MEKRERELEELKALIVRRLPKGAGKYEEKLPLKCFSCNKTEHFASICQERMSKYDRHDKFDKPDRNDRYEKHEKYDKPYKPNRNYKHQKNCHYVVDEGVIDEESKGDEVVFIVIKEDGPIPVDSTSCTIEEKALAAKVEEKDEWVIDSGFFTSYD